MKHYNYEVQVKWTGNEGEGTSSYQSYKRCHTITVEGKYEPIKGSSDPHFLGEQTKYNPEELFLSSLSACHMLWYLHLCATHGITVSAYEDKATGTMQENSNGSGSFKEVILHPQVKILEENRIAKANELHKEANKMCFIANSCNFKITHQSHMEIV